jgi:Putative prokaryotic signal transducing protein
VSTKDTQEAFVKLVTANGLVEADTWKAVLEANGITVFLRHEALAQLEPVSVAYGNVDLWVPREMAARALEILQDERTQPEFEEEP